MTPIGVTARAIRGRDVTGLPDPVGSPFIWYPMDEGSGTTVNDNAGTHDGTINGASWTSGTYVGGWALDGDGSDDWIESDTWGSFGSGLTSDFAICMTLEIPSGDNGYVVAVDDTGQSGPALFTGTRDFINDNAGEFGISVYDDGATNNIGISTDAAVDDGTKRRVVLNKTGNTEAGLAIYFDGSEATYSTFSAGTLSSASNFTDNVGVLSRDGGIAPSDATIDDLVVYQTSLTTAQITDDYQRQPWS